jgi:hypothetical protein
MGYLMNFRVIDGDDDYLEKVPEFVEEYNRNYLTIPKLCEKLDLSVTEYRKLRKHCIEEDLITLRRRENRKKKVSSRNYTTTIRGNRIYWRVYKNGRHYCTCKTEKEAKEIVERLKKCNWDINRIDMIKESVCG